MIFMHYVLSGLFIPTLLLPNSLCITAVWNFPNNISLFLWLPHHPNIVSFEISLFPEQNFSFFSHFALTLTWDGRFNERNSSISPSNCLFPAHDCHTYHGQHLYIIVVAAFSVATSRSNASTSLCYLSQRSKPETL